MSDFVNGDKTEDVLSSIRRLVTDTPVGAARVRNGRAVGATGLLVLTPFDLIDADPARHLLPPLKLRRSDLRGKPAVGRDRADGSTPDLLSTIAELEAAVLGQSDDWEDDGAGTQLDKNWASAGFGEDTALEAPIEVHRSAWPAPPDDAGQVAATAGSFPEGDPDPDPSSQADAAGILPLDPAWQVSDGDEPDGSASPEAGRTPNMFDRSAEGADTDGPTPLNFFREEDADITREALARMVRDIVREEFQGQLGERVSYRLRKLVRREIHRAISTRSLD